jgi:hypothetical protein
MKKNIALFGPLAIALSASVAHADCASDIQAAVTKQAAQDLGTSKFSIGMTDVFAGPSVEFSSVQILAPTDPTNPEMPAAVIANYEVEVETNDSGLSAGSLSQSCTILQVTRLN